MTPKADMKTIDEEIIKLLTDWENVFWSTKQMQDEGLIIIPPRKETFAKEIKNLFKDLIKRAEPEKKYGGSLLGSYHQIYVAERNGYNQGVIDYSEKLKEMLK